MSIGIMELIFILVTSSFYFYALYLLILTLYETNRSDRPQPNGEHEESKQLNSAVLNCLYSGLVMIIATLLLSVESIALGYLYMVAAITLTLSALTYFYLLYVLVLALYETYRSDRPQPNGDTK